MKIHHFFILGLASLLTVSCAKSADDEEVTTNTLSVGNSVNTISAALASIGGLSTASHIEPAAGVANTQCSATGGPLASGSDVTPSSNSYASALGYCQATFNAQSPDTARGAMYIAGGIACEAQAAGLFSSLTVGAEATSTTLNVTFNTDCWGSQAEVDALVADNGGTTTMSIAVTLARFDTSSASRAYEYFLGFNLGGGSEGIYLNAAATGYSALYYSDTSASNTSAWAVNLDLANGVVYYEGIDGSNSRRVRLRVDGTINSAGSAFTAVTSISGFHMQGSSGTQALSTFSGSLSAGLLGSYYSTATADSENNCHLPTNSSVSCSGVTGISGSDANATSLYSSIDQSADTLANYQSSFVNFQAVDPSDADVTQ